MLTNPQDMDIIHLAPCTHEEADIRIFLHVADAVSQGHQKITIRTVDTNFGIFTLSLVKQLHFTELWIAYGRGKSFRFIAAHAINEVVGQVKSKILTVFHSFTGCGTSSAFNGRGKKSNWDTWKVYEDTTNAFLAVASAPQLVSDVVMATLE